jgi:hypothetical protein
VEVAVAEKDNLVVLVDLQVAMEIMLQLLQLMH